MVLSWRYGYRKKKAELDYLLAGACADSATGFGGAFTFNVIGAPSAASWATGCGLSSDMPIKEDK